MWSLNDPAIWAGLLVLLLLVAKGAYALWQEFTGRRDRRLREEMDLRVLLADYRARYGAGEALRQLESDLEESRTRVEGLVTRWKNWQRRAEEALGEREERTAGEEERKAYRAFLSEARRLRLLKRAELHFKE